MRAQPSPRLDRKHAATLRDAIAIDVVRDLFAGSPTDEGALRHAVGATSLAAWTEGNLITRRRGAVLPLVRFAAYQDLIIASDPLPRSGRPQRANHVMGPGDGTDTMVKAMVPATGKTVDLGTGSGLLALLAASDAREVIALDKNPRALAFASLNAAVNGIARVEARRGDMFAPDAGLDGCDRVVCHPPHVISPDASFAYSDSEGPGDGYVPVLLRAVAGLLRPGGHAQILASFADLDDASWTDRLEGWLAATRCEAWVLVNPLESPDDYARRWLGDRGRDAPRARRRWLDHYDAHGIRGVCSGLVNLRRPLAGERPWIAVQASPPRIEDGAAAHVLRGFANHGHLARHGGDEAIAAMTPRPAPDLVTESLDGATWASSLAGGLCFRVEHGTAVARLVRGCDGLTPVRAIVDRICGDRGEERGPALAVAIDVVRDFVRCGLLLPA